MVVRDVNYKLFACTKLLTMVEIHYNAGGGMLMLVNIIGFLAAFTSTISLIPQVIKMYKTRSVDDLSTWMIVNFLLTSILWVIYGFLITSWSVWLTNIFMLLFALIMIWLKVRYGKMAG